MPSSSSSSLALPVRLIEPLAERGSDVPLATLAAGFRNAAKSYLPAESWFEVSVRIWHTLRQLADSMPAPAAAEPDDAESESFWPFQRLRTCGRGNGEVAS